MRLVWSVLSIAGLAYVGFALLLYLNQASYVFLPSRVLVSNPRDVGLSYDDVLLTADDGTLLHAWFVPASKATYTLLFLHGNAGNISHRLDSLKIFNGLGLSTLILDYRGYGRSQGRPSEAGTYQDAEAGWRYLTQTRGIPAHRIIVFGRSLGGGVAAWLATQHEPRAVILESTPTSVPDIGAELYPFLPVRLLTRIRYDTLRRVTRIRRPLLVVHSRDDDIIPFAHGRRIFEAANEPKAFLEIRGDHNNGFLTSSDEYTRGLAGFLQALTLEEDGAVGPTETTESDPEANAAPDSLLP